MYPQDLSQHKCLTYSLMNPTNEWRFTDKDRQCTSMKVNQIFTADSPEMLLKLARQGLGVVALPGLDGQRIYRDRGINAVIRRLSNDYLPGRGAVYHASDYLPQRIRVFIDFYCGVWFLQTI